MTQSSPQSASFTARLARSFVSRARSDDWRIARALYVRSLGLALLAAFWSLRTQVLGLIGAHGLQPVATHLATFRDHVGLARFVLVPTVLWIDSSDRTLVALGNVGVAVSALIVTGLFPRVLLGVACVLVLSFAASGSVFFDWECDQLLLETGLLAMFLYPARWSGLAPRGTPVPRPPWLIVCLFQLFLARFLLMAGLTKLFAPDWQRLDALSFHFATEPLPNGLTVYASRAPERVKQALTLATLAIECIVPVFVFAPRRLRARASIPLVALQVGIGLTGNYAWFNWLTAALGAFMVDDASWAGVSARVSRCLARDTVGDAPGRVEVAARGVLAFVSAVLGTAQLVALFVGHRALPAVVGRPLAWIAPFNVVNAYAPFAHVPHERFELVFEGSRDGVAWRPYEMRCKPGRVDRAPGWCAPGQPRLDWLTWAAHEWPAASSPWVSDVTRALLDARPDVIALFERDPFPDGPPRTVRVARYRYRYATAHERMADGAFWVRERIEDFQRPRSAPAE